MLDFVVKVDENYPKILLKECKYQTKKNKMENRFNDNLESSSFDDETQNNSDSEPDNESDNE